MLNRPSQWLARLNESAAARNFGWLLVERGVRLVFVTGVGFLVARYLGPIRFGSLSSALAVVALLMPLAELGLEAVARRELIENPQDSAVLAATVMRLRLVGAGGALLVLAVLLKSDWLNDEERGLVVILGVTLFQPALWVADTWLQSRLAARVSVVVQLAVLAAGALVRLVLVSQHASLAVFAWVFSAEFALTAAGLFGAARLGGLRYGAFDRATAGRLLQAAWPLLFSSFAVILYLRLDQVMLRALVGEHAVGLYAAATRFTEVWYFVPGALAASLLPSLLRARAAGAEVYAARLQKFYDLYAAVAYGVSLPVMIGAVTLVKWAYGPAFSGGGAVLTWHAGSLVFVFLGVARGQYLVSEGHTRFYLFSTAAGLLTNIGLNFVLIPAHGAAGAAVATLVAQAVAAWLSTFCFAPARANAWMQTRALLIWLRWPTYVLRT